MKTKLGFTNEASATVERKRDCKSALKTKGHFIAEHWRDGKCIGKHKLLNGVTNDGIDSILEVYFNSGGQITTWYIGMIDDAGFSALAAGDTMSSHAGWTELTAYTEGTRPTWTPGAAASQQITNPTPADFNMNAVNTIKGTFLVSANVKGGTGGTLWATALFASTIPVTGGDLIKVTYTTAGS